MNPVSIVLFIIVAIATTWLVIDTIVNVVKKVRAKKQDKHEEEKKE